MEKGLEPFGIYTEENGVFIKSSYPYVAGEETPYVFIPSEDIETLISWLKEAKKEFNSRAKRADAPQKGRANK